jgi:hypothetical protein
LQIDFVLKLNRFTMTQTQENYIYIRVYGIGKIHFNIPSNHDAPLIVAPALVVCKQNQALR